MSPTVRDTFQLACPKCGSDEHLQVAIEAWANLSADGTEPVGDHDWNNYSACRCTNCDFDGAVETFRVPVEPDPLKTFEVTFTEDVSYRAVVRASDPETARALIRTQLEEGGVDALEETHNCRSDFEVEEVVS